ncbi:hypothetical protein RF11_14898 [Thelohanellus kitauei]|uniref:Uncharacterized protein n=1 Tax=Thelohanellus kitauei TaxID=669202 RepID=A0A0C2MWG1_THEKT|nr:hypothetical protein RF11_14898 [Thelohanellus kitauei]
MLASFETNIESINDSLGIYLSLLNDALYPSLTDSTKAVEFSNKIRQVATFSWDQCICADNIRFDDNYESVCVDLAFDMVNMLFQAGLYFMIKSRKIVLELSQFCYFIHQI